MQVSKRLHTPSHHDLQASFYADASVVPGVEAVEGVDGEGRPEAVRRRPLSRFVARRKPS